MKAWARRGTLTGLRLKSALDPHEVQILRSLVNSLVELIDERVRTAPKDELTEMTGIRLGHSRAPESGPLARLLPNFHRPETSDSDEGGISASENAAMRSLHEPGILDAKRHSADVVLHTLPARGGTVSVTPEQAQSWLACINDIRLSLGSVLLDEHETIPEDMDSSDPMAGQHEIYHWLTFMQDTLCTALMGEE